MIIYKLKLIEHARNLISDKNNWIQYALAKDSLLNTVRPSDPAACKFCAMGALCNGLVKFKEEISNDLATEIVNEIIKKCKDLYNIGTIINVNDEIGYETVLNVFDSLITDYKDALRASSL